MNTEIRNLMIYPAISFFSKYCGYLFLIIILSGFSAALLMQRTDWFVKSLIIGIPGIIAAIYLIIRKTSLSLDEAPQFEYDNKIIDILFIALYLFSICLVYIYPYRIWLYFVVLACISGVVVVKIFNKDLRKNVALFFCFLIMVNLSFCVTLNYAYFFGTTDLFFHIQFSDLFRQLDHIFSSDFELTYASHPLLYIYEAISSSLTNIPIKTVYFLSLGLIFASSVFIVYKIFSIITRNDRLSLLTCLIYCFSSVVVMYGENLITRTMAYLGFILLFYLFLKYEKMSKIQFYVLFFLVTLFIMLVHQVSIFQIIFVFAVFFTLEFLIVKKQTIQLKHLFFLLFLTVIYWIYLNYDLTSLIIKTRMDYFGSESTTRIITTTLDISTEQRIIPFLYSNISFGIITLLSLIGIGVILREKRHNILETIAFFSLIMSLIYIPNPTQMIYGLMEIFRADRLQLLIAPFFAFVMGCGVIAIYAILNSHSRINRVSKIAVILIICIFSFYSISTFLATDCEDLNRDQFPNFPRYLNTAEYTGIIFTQNFIPYGSTLRSDNFVNQYYRYKKSQIADKLNLPYFDIKNLMMSDHPDSDTGYDVIRYKYFIKNGLFFYIPNEDSYLSIRPDNKSIKQITDKIFEQNTVYNSKYVLICNNELRR